MTQTTTRPALSYLDTAMPLPVTAEIALRVAVVFAKWAERRRSRHALGRLDAHLLRDIGLTHRDARLETVKPFWRD